MTRSMRLQDNSKAVFLAGFYLCETGVARRIKALINAPKSMRDIDSVKAIDWVQGQLAIALAGKQSEAVRRAIENKVMVITGGPGTGKTTIINAILKIYARLNSGIMLAAPTGRAAKRMSETTGFDCQNHSPAAGIQPAKGRLSAQRGQTARL